MRACCRRPCCEQRRPTQVVLLRWARSWLAAWCCHRGVPLRGCTCLPAQVGCSCRCADCQCLKFPPSTPRLISATTAGLGDRVAAAGVLAQLAPGADGEDVRRAAAAVLHAAPGAHPRLCGSRACTRP